MQLAAFFFIPSLPSVTSSFTPSISTYPLCFLPLLLNFLLEKTKKKKKKSKTKTIITLLALGSLTMLTMSHSVTDHLISLFLKDLTNQGVNVILRAELMNGQIKISPLIKAGQATYP